MKNKFIALTILILVITLTTSCSSQKSVQKILDKVDTSQADEMLESSFDIIRRNDYEAFVSIFDYPLNEEDFNGLVNELALKKDEELLEYKLVGYFVNMKNGNTTYEYNYNIKTSNKNYVGQIILIPENDSSRKYMGFKIYEGQLDEDYPAIVGISPWQIVILIYSALCWAFIIFTIVKCARSKVRLKWLWIIGIIIQHGITFFRSASNATISFKFFWIGISQLVLNNQGTYFSLTIVFPIIALIFLLIKKSIENKYIKRQEMLQAQEEELNRLSQERINNGTITHSEILETPEVPQSDSPESKL